MKKLLTLALAACMILSLCACGAETPAGSEASEAAEPAAQTYHWKLAHEEYEGDPEHEWALAFKDALAELSDGRITLDVYAVGQLGDSTNQVEMLQTGAVEFGINSPGAVGAFIPESGVFNLHYVLPSDGDLLEKILNDGEGIACLNSFY